MGNLASSAAKDNVFRSWIAIHFDDAPPSLIGIDEWVREHYVYQPEAFELIRTPQYMLNEILERNWFSGDCDDAATFIAAILKIYDYPAEFVAIRYSDPSEFEHVFVVSGNFVLDPTVPYGTDYFELERMTERV